jgi:hypothetical protein
MLTPVTKPYRRSHTLQHIITGCRVTESPRSAADAAAAAAAAGVGCVGCAGWSCLVLSCPLDLT